MSTYREDVIFLNSERFHNGFQVVSDRSNLADYANSIFNSKYQWFVNLHETKKAANAAFLVS
jgi:hypothetical protein